MKKRFAFIIALLTFFIASKQQLFAQSRKPAKSGKISFLVTNRYSLYIAGKEDKTDSAFLYFNDTASSYYVVQKIPTYDEVVKQTAGQPGLKATIPEIVRRMEERQKRHFYFHKAGSTTVSYPWVGPIGDDWFCIRDTIPTFSWELLPDTMRILGFLCQKATFRSSALGNIERPYTAWFAPDLAYAYGPSRFFGLPGMILELNNQYYHYKAVSIDLPLSQEGIFAISCCSGLPSLSKQQADKITSKAHTDLENMKKVQGDKN